MVAGIRCYLAAAGVDVTNEMARTSLVLSSDQNHLVGGRFDIDSMIQTLEGAVDATIIDGYRGLWASGDMMWEFGQENDFAKLLEYEWRLEELFRRRDQLCGICQYHMDILPVHVVQTALLMHPSIFINETLSRINPYYAGPKPLADLIAADHSTLNNNALSRLLSPELHPMAVPPSGPESVGN